MPRALTTIKNVTIPVTAPSQKTNVGHGNFCD